MTKLYGIPFPSVRIAFKFDLELIQYDVVNALVDAPIDQDMNGKQSTLDCESRHSFGKKNSPKHWPSVDTDSASRI